MSDRPKPPEGAATCSHTGSDAERLIQSIGGLCPLCLSDGIGQLCAALHSRDARIAELEERVEELVRERDNYYRALKELRERGQGE